MTPANLSRIETGAQQFTRDNLLAVAKALQCEPFELIGPFEPGADEQSFIAELRRLPPAERAKLIRVLRALREAQAA